MTLPARLSVLAVAVAALPVPAAAEGNRLVLSCDPLVPPAATGADGAAAAMPAHPGFTFTPLRVDRNGAGPVEVTAPDGRTAPGVTASFQGPFAWTLDTTLHTLTVKGTTADGRVVVLWHRLDQAQAAVPPEGALTKLICEVA